jgi:Zn-finger nucleic acid-binding protein
VAPYRTHPRTRTRACPRCAGIALQRRALGHVAVDECPGCQGVFVDGDALDEIVEDLGLHEEVRAAYRRGPVSVPRETGFLACPRCGDRMNRQGFAPGAKVIVDRCRAHGTWFDRRELPAVVEFVEVRRAVAERRAATEPSAPRVPASTRSPDSATAAPSTALGALADALLQLLTWSGR